ncbi:MAG TPA: sulfite exporter TauE/SafE family protein [Thermohalobaculum sp.]|nr:sulfite exporter TauE/SafE family protein [Thermohalobaculum sp.]
MEAPLLAGLDPLTVVTGIAVCFFAAALGGVAGMGSGMIITLFLLPVVGPKALVPVMSVLMLFNTSSRLWFYRHSLVRERVLPIAVVAIPMSGLGALLYVRLEGALIQVLLGAILLGSVPLRRWTERRRLAPGSATMIAASGVYGFLSSVIVGAGILLLPMLMGFGLAGPALLATDAAISVLVNIAKVIFFGKLDALSAELFVLALAMGLITIPGTWAGVWVVRHTPLRVHTLLIEGLIALGGLSMIWGGLRA